MRTHLDDLVGSKGHGFSALVTRIKLWLCAISQATPNEATAGMGESIVGNTSARRFSYLGSIDQGSLVVAFARGVDFGPSLFGSLSLDQFCERRTQDPNDETETEPTKRNQNSVRVRKINVP